MKFGLYIKANLENVTNLRPDRNDFRWYFKIKCGTCNEITSDFIYFTENDCSELKGSRGKANFVYRCKFCKLESNIDIIKSSISSYNVENNEKFQLLAEFDCRGNQPIEFEPRLCWLVDSTCSSTKFVDVNLSDKDWSDYDETANCTVGIYDMVSKIDVLKGH